MEFNYTVTLEDIMRFGEHVYRTSPRVRREKRFSCIITPLFLAVCAFQYYRESRRFDWLFFLIAIPAVMSAIFLPRQYDRFTLRTLFRRFILRPEGNDTGSLRLLVTDDSITEISATKQTKLMWDQVHRIEILPDHIYIYASAHSGIVVPRHSFCSEEAYEDLQREVMRHVQKKGV